MMRYQRADAGATTALIRQVSPLLLRYFVSQCRNLSEAEDLLQETWLQIHRARHTYRPGDPFLPWAYAIARHVRVDGYRRSARIRSREQFMSPLPEPSIAAGSPLASGPDFDELIAVLPASQREVVTMLKASGMSLEEVARATASSVGSVKLKAHRAYEKLRGVLKREGSALTQERSREAPENSSRSRDDVV
jgi:RNA polymerase sigma-70 factor, ECF subfamily